MIYTLTFNPSLDYVMTLDQLMIGKTNRSSQEKIYPGGKGFNVSILLHRMHMPTLALGFIAGFTGREICRQLEQRQIPLDLCELSTGNSRINVKLDMCQETEINGQGPCITMQDLDLLWQKLDRLTSEDILVLAGSLPSSLPCTLYRDIVETLNRKQVCVVVDASGTTLKEAIQAHPFLVKPNRDELSEIFNTKLSTKEDIINHAFKLQALGARYVLVSLGQDGAILVNEKGQVYHQEAPHGQCVHSVGSGDSMIAGFLTGYLKSHDDAIALKLGVACGSATAFHEDLATIEQIETLYRALSG